MRTAHAFLNYRSIGAFAALLLLSAQSCDAVTLKEALELAVHNDPTFLTAQANLDISRERADQALAGIFPQLTASANTTDNHREYKLRTDPPQTDSPKERYNSNSAQLNLTQPLWRHSSVIAMTQADLVVSQSDFQLKAAAQDLLVRLTQAWLETMQARDGIQVAEVQLRAAQLQLEHSQRGHERGILSLADLEEARTKYEQAIAELAVVQSELEIRMATLEQITGPVVHIPPVLSEQFVSPSTNGTPLDQWLIQLEASSPAILAAQRALDAAHEEIRKQRAGHEPTLDIVASYGKSSQGAGVSGGQLGFDSKLNTVGLQFNMPLYSGGGQVAKVREAIAMREKAMQELESARRGTRLTAKQAWFTLRASGVREASARQAVHSAALSLKGAQSAREHGVKADSDVLQAQQQHAIALRDWRKARYDAILGLARLKAACGQLNEVDLVELDKAFALAN